MTLALALLLFTAGFSAGALVAYAYIYRYVIRRLDEIRDQLAPPRIEIRP